MICNKCGSQLPEDALFCTECGARLEKEDTAPTVHTDDEPTSILPRLEEVIADNEETLSLTQEQAEMLSDEPTEILSTAEEIKLPEPEPKYEDVTEVLTAPEPVPVPEPEPVPPPMHSAQEKPAEAPVEAKPVNNGYDDNSDTMKIPVQNTSYEAPTEQFTTNSSNNFGGNGTAANNQDVILPPPPVMPREPEPVQPQASAPIPEPVPAPMPAQNDEKARPKKKVSGGRIFAASLVSLLTMVFLLLFSVLLAVKIGANGSIIRSRAEKLNAKTTLTAEFDGKELAKTFYDSLGFRTATKGAANEEGFKRYMLNTDFREYAGSVAEGYLDYIIDGEGRDPSITAEDLVNDFIKANKKAIVKEFEYDLTDDDYDLLQHNLDKDNFTETMDIKEWNRNAGFDVGKLSFAFSYITIGIVAALVLLFLIWIAAIVDKRAKHVTGFFGSIFTVVGVISFLTGLTVFVGSAIAFTFTHNVLFYLSESLLLPLAMMFCIIGAAEFILGFVFRKTKNGLKKKEKKAAAAAAPAPTVPNN